MLLLPLLLLRSRRSFIERPVAVGARSSSRAFATITPITRVYVVVVVVALVVSTAGTSARDPLV